MASEWQRGDEARELCSDPPPVSDATGWIGSGSNSASRAHRCPTGQRYESCPQQPPVFATHQASWRVHAPSFIPAPHFWCYARLACSFPAMQHGRKATVPPSMSGPSNHTDDHPARELCRWAVSHTGGTLCCGQLVGVLGILRLTSFEAMCAQVTFRVHSSVCSTRSAHIMTVQFDPPHSHPCSKQLDLVRPQCQGVVIAGGLTSDIFGCQGARVPCIVLAQYCE